MAETGRVTVTLPTELIRRIDRIESNRSRFVAQAVQHELSRRRQEQLLLSLAHPHAETLMVAESGIEEWGARLPVEREPLVDEAAGKAVRWVEDRGWIEE